MKSYKVVVQLAENSKKEGIYSRLSYMDKLTGILKANFSTDTCILMVEKDILDDAGALVRSTGFRIEEVKSNPASSLTRIVTQDSAEGYFRIIGSNPFTDFKLLDKAFKYFCDKNAEYGYFTGAPTGIAPAEYISSELITGLEGDGEFQKYLEVNRDSNIISWFRKSRTIRTEVYDCEYKEGLDTDLTIQNGNDFKVLSPYIGKEMSISELSLKIPPKIIMAHLEPTNHCNLKCIMCPRETRHKFGHMRLDVFRNIIDKMPYLRRININGDGEPFLNPNLGDMLEYAKSKGIKTRTISNATILPEKDKLRKILGNLDYFNISMDGATKDTYEKIRVGGDFSVVKENVRNIMSFINEEDLTFDEFWINYVVQQSNYRELVDMVKLLAELGVPAVNFKLMNSNFDRGDSNRSLNSEIIKENIEDNMFFDRKYMEKSLNEAESTGRELGVRVWYEQDIDPDFSYRKCAMDKKVFITWDGQVTPCCLRTVPEVLNFGNIAESSYEEVFGSIKYRSFINRLYEEMPHTICCNCPALETLEKRTGEA